MKTLLAPDLIARFPLRWQPAFRRLPTLNVWLVLATFAVAMSAAIWTFAISYLHQERERALQDARDTGANYVRAVEEHAVRTFQAADQTVLFIKYEVENFGTEIDIPRYLKSGIILGDIFNLVTVVDSRGDVVGSSRPFTSVNLSDREHVRTHRDTDSGRLFISAPVKGRVSGKWSIQMTRRANAVDGSLLGVVVISMDPFYFTRFYRQIESDSRTLVALVGDDGVVRAQRDGNDESVAADVGQTGFFARFARDVATGTFDTADGLDGRRRVYAYRRIAGYPLTAVVGMDEEEALAPYDRARSHTMSWAIGATQFILLFSIVMALLVRRLEKSRQLALAASEAKSDFLANMSHELRTPLHGILGYAELLDEKGNDPVTRRYVDAIARSGHHLLNLVNDILDIGRIESGKSEVTPTEFDLVAFMGDIDSAYRSSASLKGVALCVEVASHAPRSMTCDEMKLKQILNNLVHNAIKFTDRGTVAVRVDLVDDHLRFDVIDTGCGIPKRALGRIFEKFQQADSSLARSHEGTGLGLALVKQMTALIGGTIAVESRLSAGSHFTLTVPAVPPAATSKRGDA